MLYGLGLIELTNEVDGTVKGLLKLITPAGMIFDTLSCQPDQAPRKAQHGQSDAATYFHNWPPWIIDNEPDSTRRRITLGLSSI